MQYYDLNIGVTGSRFIDVRASFIYFLNGSAGGSDTTIKVKNESGGDEILLKPGQAFRLPNGQFYNRWIISNYLGQAAIVGQLLLGEGDFFDGRISGSVEVIDGGKARVLADATYIGAASQIAVAAQNSHCQLWNPAGSGENLIVEQIFLASTVNTGYLVRSSIVALTSLGGTGYSKKIRVGQAASSAELRYQANAGLLGLNPMFLLNAAVNTSAPYVPREPIVVAPGSGLLIVGQSLNADITASFEWFEELI